MKKLFFFMAVLVLIALSVVGINYKAEIKRGMVELILSDETIPTCYISTYQEAANQYSIPWKLLAAIHRVETVFSNKTPMISHAGAVGHFQFMPRTWIGWEYSGTKLGKITDDIDITNIELIKKYGGYGTDASGDGKADPFDFVDATHSAAKYLADHGASNDQIEKALFSYNQSSAYVENVLYYYDIYKHKYKDGKMRLYCNN